MEKESEIQSLPPTRRYTISLALPISSLNAAYNLQLKTSFVWKISRIVSLYGIDEIILLEDPEYVQNTQVHTLSSDAYLKDPTKFLTDLLCYFETPFFMRKELFPLNPHLKYTSCFPLLPLRNDKASTVNIEFPYREGIVTHPSPQAKNKYIINAGLSHNVIVSSPSVLAPRTRVTVRLKAQSPNEEGQLQGDIVSFSAPREKGGHYWGYKVRSCLSSQLCKSSPYKGGYDFVVQINSQTSAITSKELEASLPSSFRHAVLVLQDNVVQKELVDSTAKSISFNPFPVSFLNDPIPEEILLAAMTRLSDMLLMHGRR